MLSVFIALSLSFTISPNGRQIHLNGRQITMMSDVPDQWKADSKKISQPNVDAAAEEVKELLESSRDVAAAAVREAMYTKAAPKTPARAAKKAKKAKTKAMDATAEAAAEAAKKVANVAAEKVADVNWKTVADQAVKTAARSVEQINVAASSEVVTNLKTVASASIDKTKEVVTKQETKQALGSLGLAGRAIFELGYEALAPSVGASVEAVKASIAAQATKRLVERLSNEEKEALILAKLADGTPTTKEDLAGVLGGRKTEALPPSKE